MKAIVCEMCSSNNVVKTDGFFVCQNCGTKYSVEEAKKLMIEGTVDVSGSSVKIDSSDDIKNLLVIARRAMDGGNYDRASKHYESILTKDPYNWEATFYSVYCIAYECKIRDIDSAANSVKNNIKTVMQLIKSRVENKNDIINAVKEIYEKCLFLSTHFTKVSVSTYTQALNIQKRIDSVSIFQHNEVGDTARQEYLNRCCASRDIMYEIGDSITSVFNYEELKPIALASWKDGIAKHAILMNHFANKLDNQRIIESYEAKIRIIDPSYHAPVMINSSKKGCYVATCVYGSYDCPQVWTLRRYRDYTLAETWYGRAFIHTYYAISPTLVKWFGHTNWFKRMWRGKLDRMVGKLNSKGVMDTPYEDRRW